MTEGTPEKELLVLDPSMTRFVVSLVTAKAEIIMPGHVCENPEHVKDTITTALAFNFTDTNGESLTFLVPEGSLIAQAILSDEFNNDIKSVFQD